MRAGRSSRPARRSRRRAFDGPPTIA